MALDDDTLLHRIDEHLRLRLRSGDHVQQVGPFEVCLDRLSRHPFRNYALADPGAAPTASDVVALCEAFAARERLPRVEFLPACAPLVEGALSSGGFVEERRVEVMVRPVSRADSVPAPTVPGTRLTRVEPDLAEDVAGACVVAHLAFEEDGMPDENDLRRLSDMLRAGGGAVLVRSAEGGDGGANGDGDDEPVGSARYVAPVAGVAEVVGVAVAVEWRGRGIAPAMVSALVEMARAAGIEILWLSAIDAAAGRVYERAGFRRIAESLHMGAAL